jgi:hypothetical protein
VRLLIPQIEELEALMLQMPALVDALEEEDFDAQERSRSWLVRMEQALERNRLAPDAGTIAALRAELQMVALGAIPQTLTFVSPPTRRRLQESALLDVLRRAEQTVAATLAAPIATHGEAEQLMRQLIAIARHKEVPGTAPPGPGDDAGLREVWRVIRSDPDMTSGTVRIVGLVGEADTIALLDRGLAAV